MMSRKIKKYDIVTLIVKENEKENIRRCTMGQHLVLSVKPKGIKLFSVRSLNILEYTLKQFSKKYEVRFYG